MVPPTDCLNKNNYNFNHPLLFSYVDFITQIFLFRDTHLKANGSDSMGNLLTMCIQFLRGKI